MTFEELKAGFYDMVAGFTLSGLGAVIAPEIIHLFFVILGGLLGTLAVNISREVLWPWIKKKLGIKLKEQ
jgi:hypothetical protein